MTQPPPELLERYATRGPRYTSYPTAPNFHEDVDRDGLAGRWGAATNDLSIYAHIPYCAVRCLFCGCHTVITHKHEKAQPYVSTLLAELSTLAKRTDLSRPVRQLALGGGTPNFLTPPDMRRFIGGLEEHLNFADDAERSIECDPRTVTPEYIHMLHELGFNRFSFGVQDLDPDVMAAVNRNQSLATVEEVVTAVRSAGDLPINFDLIYGLPRQTEDSWRATLDEVVRLRPSRLAIYGYAHVPNMKRHQTALERHGIPSDALRSRLNQMALQSMSDAGYEAIGFDHFALPDDELAKAFRERTLHRNFMGYTTRKGLDIVALGTSGISYVNGTYTQNAKDTAAWLSRVDGGDDSWERGFVLSTEDQIRREVILALSCNLEVDLSTLLDDPVEHFAAELAQLAPMRDDGILSIDGPQVRLSEVGRPFVRNVCMVFDQYLRANAGAVRFSRTS